RHHNIHQRSGSPLNLAEDDLSLGNLKFVPKGKIDETKQAKPAPAKQLKPKPIKEKSTKPKPTSPQKARKGKVTKAQTTPATEEASTRPSAQPQDDTSANIVRETPSPANAKTGTDTDKVITEVPPLSTPIIDLLPLKLVDFPRLEPLSATTTETTTTTLPLPPLQQQQSTTDSELAARVMTLEKKFFDFEQKSQTLDKATQNLGSMVFTLELQDLPHKINQTVNEVVKEAPPTPKSSTWKTSDTKEAPFSSSNQQSAPHSKQPVEDVPIQNDVNISDSEDTDTSHLPKIKTRPDWLKPVPEEYRPETPEPD
nr:hypothetical protein [Tanacetum cinerariifolium]